MTRPNATVVPGRRQSRVWKVRLSGRSSTMAASLGSGTLIGGPSQPLVSQPAQDLGEDVRLDLGRRAAGPLGDLERVVALVDAVERRPRPEPLDDGLQQVPAGEGVAR